jgi:PAS domain S-box-containing protein
MRILRATKPATGVAKAISNAGVAPQREANANDAPPGGNRAPLTRLALRVAIIYAIAGFLWILFSDMALVTLVSDRSLIGKLSMLKGWMFVSATALLLYFLLRRRLAAWEREAGARSAAELEAREHQALYHSLVEWMPAGIFRKDAAGRYVYVNAWFCRIAGLAPADYLRKTASQVAEGLRGRGPMKLEAATGASIFSQGEMHHEKIMQTGERIELEEEWLLPDGRRYCLQVTKTPVFDASGKIVGSQGILFDITDRKRAEEELRTLSRAIEQSPASIVITDLAGAIQYVNPRFTELSGYTLPEVRGQTLRIIKSGQTPPEVYRELWSTIQAGHEWHGEFCNRKKNGELFWESASISPVFDDRGKIVHFVAVKEDITERRRFEEHLRRSQRLEAVGALASGIAHDLNNILAPVLMAPGLLKETVRTEQERELLELIEQSAQRASDVVKQLLTFSRGSGGERIPLHVQHLLREMRGIVAETFPRNITLRLNMAPGLRSVLGDATQLHQVLLNLCVNARDAMPAGGTLTLCAENTLVDAELARVNPPAKPGPHIMLRITDTGQGMAAEIIERIFDPFFTTKEVGKGTGLGLSTVLGIVRSHGGFLTVESQPGRGATFRVYLPAAPSAPTPPARAATGKAPRGQNELILIVDDEPSISESTRIVLERCGYRALAATSGAEALELFRLRSGEISLVLTDVMMPGMDGITMLREMRGIRPDIRAVVTTGMTSESKQTELADLGITESLLKPCDRGELLEAVRTALTD